MAGKFLDKTEATELERSVDVPVRHRKGQKLRFTETGDLELISIVIPNYNGSRFIERCLLSIRSQDYSNFEVIVVDNASTDSSLELVQRIADEYRFPVRVVRNPCNLGYGAALELGVRVAKGDVFVFLNNDTDLAEGCLSELLRASAEPSVGICQSMLVYGKTGLVNAAGIAMDPLGHTFLIDQWKPMVKGDSEVREIFAAVGACMLVKRAAYLGAGRFDPAYFMYYEDVDLSWRARLVHFRVVCAHGSVCYHEESPQLSPNYKWRMATIFPLILRNRLRTLIKNLSGLRLALSLPVFLLVSSAAVTYDGVCWRNAYLPRAFFYGLIWNLANIRSSLALRRITQTTRSVEDKLVFQSVIRTSLEARHLAEGLVSIIRVPVTKTALLYRRFIRIP